MEFNEIHYVLQIIILFVVVYEHWVGIGNGSYFGLIGLGVFKSLNLKQSNP